MSDPRDVVRTYLRHLEEGDIESLDDVVATDVVVLRPNGEIAFGNRDKWKQSLVEEPFADLRISVEEMICEGEKVAVRYRLECVQVRPIFGVAPQNHSITTSGTKIYRVRGGRIVEIAGHDDVLGVLRQLGVVDVEV